MLGEGNGNPLQCSCLENPRDRGAWWAAVSGVAQSRTGLKRCSRSSSGTKKVEGSLFVCLLCSCPGIKSFREEVGFEFSLADEWGKESACQSRRCKKPGFDAWVRKCPWSRKWQLTPEFLLAWRAMVYGVTTQLVCELSTYTLAEGFQPLSRVQLFAIPGTAARQASDK